MLRSQPLLRTPVTENEASCENHSWVTYRPGEQRTKAQLYSPDSYCIGHAVPRNVQEHLILYHSDSGDLYYSKLPDDQLGTSDIIEADFQLKTPLHIMAQPCFLRWLLTVLHAAAFLVAGFCFAFSLYGTLFSDQCLPYLVNKDGSHIQSQPGFNALCDTVLFGMGLILVLSALMCALVQCSLSKPPMVVFSFLLTSCMGAFAVFGGSTFTVHYALWCDSLSQDLLPEHVKCSDAAAEYDRVNKVTDMRAFERQMMVQQITTWALFPLTFITAVSYALALRWNGEVTLSPEDYRDSSPPRGFYQYLAARTEVDHNACRTDSEEVNERSPFIRS